ncbi:hypothetical protein LPB138_13485 [Urechidicola croceus]|uniref:Secretion system C-terminal sorting domain-containing protein n=2 Tax=Urechidicola croceus TaxID=1850246 RepID=A0A1D8PAM1_9FLAO|nr:hypothetical protein LPB138_13485 [Urechidicola croceus]
MISLTCFSLKAQDITLFIENAFIVEEGIETYYEADVMISSTTDFYVGSGQVYINYNHDAFGEDVVSSGNVEYLQPQESITGFSWPGAPFSTPAYRDFIINDNGTTGAFSPSFQQNIALDGLETAPTELQITSVPKLLFRFRLKYIDAAATGLNPDVCFVSEGDFDDGENPPDVSPDLFQDQFFTACGRDTSSTVSTANCSDYPGTQILNDSYDCSGAAVIPLDIKNIDEYSLANIQIYPNPTTGILNINSAIELTRVEMFDILGKKILETEETTRLDLSKYRAGVYLLNLHSENGKTVRKIMIE